MNKSPILIFILALFLLMVNVLSADGIFKWRAKNGTIQYGDKPPQNIHAQPLSLPAITIIKNYKDQWKPLEPLKNTAPSITNKTVTTRKNKRSQAVTPRYSSLKFLAPKPNQVINAKDGDVSAMISIKPPLQKTHKILFSLDGKKIRSSKSRVINFQNLPAGNHQVTVKIVDPAGQIVMQTNALGFQVKR